MTKSLLAVSVLLLHQLTGMASHIASCSRSPRQGIQGPILSRHLVEEAMKCLERWTEDPERANFRIRYGARLRYCCPRCDASPPQCATICPKCNYEIGRSEKVLYTDSSSPLSYTSKHLTDISLSSRKLRGRRTDGHNSRVRPCDGIYLVVGEARPRERTSHNERILLHHPR